MLGWALGRADGTVGQYFSWLAFAFPFCGTCCHATVPLCSGSMPAVMQLHPNPTPGRMREHQRGNVCGGPPLLLACIDPPCGSPHRGWPQSIRMPGQIKPTGCQRAKAAVHNLSYLAVDIRGAVKDNLYLYL